MTEKEIKARYKHAVFGFLWVILNPLLQMVVIGFVFQFVTRIPIEHYFVFLFVGLLPWNFFSMTILKTTPIFVTERSLIQKATFPREIILLSVLLSNAFHLGISIVLFLPIVLFLGKITFLGLLLLPVVVGLLLLLASGLGLFLSSLNIRYRDINFIVQALTPLWFYATPVLYTLEFIPASLRNWFYLNPMTGIIELFHFVLLSKPVTSVYWLGLSGLSMSVILALGVWTFGRLHPYFVDWV